MKKSYTTLFVLLLFISAGAQRAEWLRYSTIRPGGNGFSNYSLVAVDQDKNSYTCREADGLVVAADTQYSAGNLDLAVIKTDSSGNHIWTKMIGTTWADVPEEICIDNEGNIYISVLLDGVTTITNDTTYNAGSTHQIIKLGPDGRFIRYMTTPGFTLITANGTDIYAVNAGSVFKMDSAFNQVWIKNIPLNSLGVNVGTSRNKISSNGHYLAFSADESFTNSAGQPVIDTVTVLFNSSTNFDQACVVLMDTSGAAYWARVTDANNSPPESPGGAWTDASGNVYFAVACSEDFALGNDTIHLNGGLDVVGVVKFDVNGNPLWTQPIHTTGHLNVKNIKGSAGGNILVTGVHSGVVQAGTYNSLFQNNGSYIVGFDPSGAISFGKFNSSAAGSGDLVGIDIHPSGDFWVSGKPQINTAWDCIDIPAAGIIITPSYWGRFSMQAPVLPQANFSYTYSANIYTFTDLSQNADSIRWDFGDGTFSNQSNPVHTYTNGLNYFVVLTAYRGICTDTDTLTLLSVGIPEIKGDVLFSITPVPASDHVILHTGAAVNTFNLRITDISGKTIMDKEVLKSGNDLVLNIQNLPNGFYFLYLNSDEKKSVLRMVVQH